MSWLRDAPIRRKLSVIIMGTAAAVLLLSLAASLVVQVGAARDAVSAHLQALATVLGDNSRATIAFRDRQAAAAILATLATQDDVVWAAIRVHDEQIFAQYRSQRFRDTRDAPAGRASGERRFDQVAVRQPIVFDGKTIAHFEILGDMSRVWAGIVRQTWLIMGVFAVSMLLALLLSSRLQRIVSLPVQRLLDAMGDVTAHRDLGRRAERVSNDELGRLTDGFNAMLDQIQAYDRKLEDYRQGLEQQVIERTEELEWAKQKAVAASKAKSDFLATMSHEIRTPMTGVIGFTKLLEKTDLNNQQRDYTRIIGSSAHSLLEIIDDILDFSKLEAGRIELENRDFEVEDLLAAVNAALTPKALEKGIALTARSAGDVPSLLHGDVVRLRQILLNLAGNAVKFTDEGEVAVRLENAGEQAGRLGLRIVVRDTGIGISAEQEALLFRPFQQGDGSITRRFGGTGLGLVITQRLVHRMDGVISVSSLPGKGSVFTATVQVGLAQPIVHRRPAGLMSAEEVAPALADLRVLVVDDSPINLKLAAALLSSRGVEVVAVESGAEALEAVAHGSFDLVLMDLEMPRMSGVEAAGRIRAAHGKAADVPIIAITAHAFPEKRQEVIEAGMNDLLAKPYLPEQLYAIIAKWCAGISLYPPGREKPAGVGDELPVCDREAALAIVGGDEAVAASMLTEFCKTLPDSEAALCAAHADADYDALYHVVHKLSGASPIVGATAVHGAAVYLQNFLRLEPRPVTRIDAGVTELLAQIARFRTTVDC